MRFRVIRGEEIPLSTWSGGTSREYVIFPPTASYKGRDFLFRMSMATSHLEGRSAYTDLPRITRHLIMLDGVVKVSHVGHYDLEMRPFEEIDVFDGGWETFGEGKAADFNLMVSESSFGNMRVTDEVGTMEIGDSFSDKVFEFRSVGLLCGVGEAKIQVEDKKVDLLKGDLLLIHEVMPGDAIEVETLTGKLVRMDVGYSL